jgi:acetaldehyde dehydrogenase
MSGARPLAAIVGPGNIGTDLLAKLQRSEHLEVGYVVGVVESDGLARARQLGIAASAAGVGWLVRQDPLPDLVFEATSAAAHRANAPQYAEAGITAIDLTPAALGPLVCPPVNLLDHVDAANINMISCGAQATVPIVHAVSSVVAVPYAEIVASVASKSAGPGTRANIDEFTHTTSRAVETVGGAQRGKAIIVLNPVEPPMIMRDTIFCAIPAAADRDAISESIMARVAEVQRYVPGYTLRADPQFDEARESWNGNARVAVFVEVRGGGDYLPEYAGNLDIMTAAAAKVGDVIAQRRAGEQAVVATTRPATTGPATSGPATSGAATTGAVTG